MSVPQSWESELDVEEREAKVFKANQILRLNRYIFRNGRPLVSGLAALGLGTFAALYEPRLLGEVIDRAIVPKDLPLLYVFVILFAILTAVRALGTCLQGYFFELLGQRVTQDLRLELFSHLQRQPMTVFDKNPAGRLLTRVTNDVASIAEMFSAGFVGISGNILLVVGILFCLFLLNTKLALITTSVFPVLVVLSAYFSRLLKVSYREARNRLSSLNAFLAENILGIRVVQLFNRQRLHLERFNRINQWYTEAQISSIRVFSLFQPAITVISAISVALLIWFGGLDTSEGEIPYGVLVAFISYILLLFQPLREIADKWNIFLSGMASAERVFSILDWKPEVDTKLQGEGVQPLSGIRGEIIFDHVWFAYEGEHWVLKDFSLRIAPGSFVGVVGHTGAGKSTLIHLLLRFYEVKRGRILLDGRDIREIDRRVLRATIGLVQQDGFLFSGSLLDNITFWQDRPGTAERLAGMLMSAGLTERVAGRISDSETLFERASNLSVGERQVLAFARAWEKKPQLWVLDEATANMDSETEERVHQILVAAAGGSRSVTRLMVAHRLASIRSADQIVVLHKGAVIESGNHEELLRLGGFYSRLYRYQESQVV